MSYDPDPDVDDLDVVVNRLLAATGIAQERQAQLQHALESRIVIEQAKGILAERLGITMDESFDRLRRTARSNRTRVHELARGIVAGDAAVAELVERR